jgi:integrase
MNKAGALHSQMADPGKLDPKITRVGDTRDTRARKDFKAWLEKVGLPYHLPHKFRHGHAVYALKNAKDVPALKAVSQNLMHANLSITDGVYGILSGMDVKGAISELGKSGNSNTTDEVRELKALVKQLLLKFGESNNFVLVEI